MLMDVYEWLREPSTIPMAWGAGVAVGFVLGWSTGRLSLLQKIGRLHVSEKRLERLHKEAAAKTWSGQ